MTDRETSPADRDNENDTILPGERDQRCDQPDESTDYFATRTNDDFVDTFATFVPADGRQVNRNAIRYEALVRGDQIGDFRIQCLLGRGSFGAVYLARELTLDRLVAVKVVLPEGQHATQGEGRSLAQLQHPGIVGVYGETHDPVSGCSLLWMQFVDGSNLASLIKQLRVDLRDEWNESDLLRLLRMLSPDAKSAPEAAVSTLHELDDRARRSVETVCWIGVQLAEALAHAHDSGITHRDIKPANILMQRDATPLLADFNLAGNESCIDGDDVSGGTIAYMPPERLAHLLGEDVLVDERRADVYSLGVVLWELACGHRPQTQAEAELQSSGGQRLLDMLRLRRQEMPKTSKHIPIGLAMVLERAICVDPERRYPSAHAMATALRGLAQLELARRRAPTIGRFRDFAQGHLFWIILIGGMLPHFAASGLQSAYNQIWIHVNDEAFFKAFIAYNIVVYPACMGWLAWNLFKFAQGYRRVVSREPIPRGHLRRLRARLLKLPRQFMIAAAVGWFPGVVLFPWLLGVFGETPNANQWFHYGISFTIAGLIATTYSYAFVMYVVVCHGYRACWQTASHYQARARYELSAMENRIRWIAILAGVLPLAAAVLLVAIGIPSVQELDSQVSDIEQLRAGLKHMGDHMLQMRGLHRLVIALIVTGAIGLYLAELASARLIRVVRALTLGDQ